MVGPRDIPHTFRNVGSSDGRLLLTVIPGHFANYFIEVDGMRDEDHAAIGRSPPSTTSRSWNDVPALVSGDPGC